MKCMPAHAEKLVSESMGNYALSIFWKLNSDPVRPNKYSKTIAILIPRELIEDFSGYSSNMQQSVITKLNSYITNKYQAFNADHDVPKYGQPPVEKWELPIEQLFC